MDLVVFAGDDVLLIKRGRPPFEGQWAIPGGFLGIDEPFEDAARRELHEETGLDVAQVPVHELGTYGAPGRDPRGRTISIAFVAVLPKALPVQGGDDARDAQWQDAKTAQGLAFDHRQILDDALAWRAKVKAGPTR